MKYALILVAFVALAAPGQVRAQGYGSPALTCDPHIAEVIGAKLVTCSGIGTVITAKDFAAPRVNVKLIDDKTGEHVRLNLPVTKRTADKAFWMWNVAEQIAIVADTENSMYAGRLPGAHEANPILGNTPNRVRYYLIGEAIWGIGSYVSWRDKREKEAAVAFGAKPDWTHRHWYLPQMANIAWHAVGIGITVIRTER